MDKISLDQMKLNMILQKPYKLVPIIGTIMESKEEIVMELFFENPTREWH